MGGFSFFLSRRSSNRKIVRRRDLQNLQMAVGKVIPVKNRVPSEDMHREFTPSGVAFVIVCEPIR